MPSPIQPISDNFKIIAFSSRKLTELPEKWKEFETKMETVKDWVKLSENVMESVHKPVEADGEEFNVS